MKFMPTTNGRHRERGTTIVEFALVASTLLLTLFIVIDLSRLIYLRMTFEEGVRRAARLATVCPLGDPLPALAARFEDPASTGVSIAGASAANVSISYLNASGQVITNLTQNYSDIRSVRVSLQNIQIPLLIPFISGLFAPDTISATAIAESLGVNPTGVPAC
ncbi:MAG: hypothetical protein RLZ79_436 [Pseudomonadota bacterium]|jgi:hypothetical protein